MSQHHTSIPSGTRQGRSLPVEVNEARSHPHRRHGWQEGERAVRTPAVPREDVRPLVARVGILGATAAGTDIAGRLLAAGIPVTLYEPVRASLDSATAALRAHVDGRHAAGELTAAQRDRQVAFLAGTVNLHHLKDCEVIVDVTCAGADVTAALVRRLSALARHDAIVMTCVAEGGIDDLAGMTRFPQNLLGFHLANAADGTPVWRFVPGRATSGSTLATATALVEELCHMRDGDAARTPM